MAHGGERRRRKGEGSAEPQLHPLMLHVSVSRGADCPALQSDKERINTKISVFLIKMAEVEVTGFKYNL